MSQTLLQSRIELIVTNGLGFEPIKTGFDKKLEAKRQQGVHRLFPIIPPLEIVKEDPDTLRAHLAHQEITLRHNYSKNHADAISQMYGDKMIMSDWSVCSEGDLIKSVGSHSNLIERKEVIRDLDLDAAMYRSLIRSFKQMQLDCKYSLNSLFITLDNQIPNSQYAFR